MMANASPTLSKQQILAVNGIIDKSINILMGAAGTGKSTVIAAVYERLGERLCVIAPTHAAAGNLEASGIPRVYQVASLTDASENTLANQLILRRNTHIIVDEASMVTRRQKLMIDDLCERAKIHLTYVGDPYQLPPVDKLLAVYEQNWCENADPDFILDTVYRQKAGVAPRLVHETFIDPNATHICMTNEKRNELNIACHVALFGENAYADKMKTILNPQPGQYLMANETSKPYNDRATGLTKVTYRNNGLYKIERVKRTRFYFEIKFAGIRKAKQIAKKEFSVQNLQRNGKRYFDFAYAITCHSAQGKGFDAVYVHIECNLLDKGNVKQWDFALPGVEIDNWLYTALTRGKKSITVIDPTGAVVRESLSLTIDPKERGKPKGKTLLEPAQTVPIFAPRQDAEKEASINVVEVAEAVDPKPVETVAEKSVEAVNWNVEDRPKDLDADFFQFGIEQKPVPVRPLQDSLDDRHAYERYINGEDERMCPSTAYDWNGRLGLRSGYSFGHVR